MDKGPQEGSPTTTDFSRPLPDAMKIFLSTTPTLNDPQLLLGDEGILILKDNSLKLAFFKMIKILVSSSTSKCTKLSEEKVPDETQSHCNNLEKVRHSLRTLELIRDSYIWENLNIGHWKEVDSGWRRSYTFLCICKAIFMAVLNQPFVEIVKECDMGLLMGEPILDNVLLAFAQDLSKLILGEDQPQQTEYDNIGLRSSEADFDIIELEKVCLKVQHPESRFELECMENPSLQQFSDIMTTQKRPILIYGGIEHWPARKKWSVDYIRKTAGFRTVPVELGSKYTSDDWTQKIMTLEEFIKTYMNKDNEQKPSGGVGYVAQHRLFEQITELGKDIKTPDYCLLGESKHVDINAWFGPGNTISPMHYDPKHNILVQVFGSKLIRLYPPSESCHLSPYPSTSILFNTSQIDLEDSSVLEKYPDLKNAQYCEFLLSPGMMLYMPPKWWHYVKSLTPSFSISFWFE